MFDSWHLCWSTAEFLFSGLTVRTGNRIKAVTASALLLVAIVGATPALAVPQFSILPLGFDDLEHTRNDGYRYSFPWHLNEAGQVIGGSGRYNVGGANLGATAWLYDGATMVKLGFTGPEHTRSNGLKDSFASALNNMGLVIGYSKRFNGGPSDVDESAWLYDGATTIQLGHTGPEYTRSDGLRFSFASTLNDAGQVSGYSSRYNGGSVIFGQTAWLYDGATTIDIGLTGPEHTREDGPTYNDVKQLNEAGQVIGLALRYNEGSELLGYSAWLYNGTTTIPLGFTGPEYTRSDGYKNSVAYDLNEAGQICGTSSRHSGDADLGSSAWLYDGTTTIEIGLTGPGYTYIGGQRHSFASDVNEAGQVVGYSFQYDGADVDGPGRGAWLYDGTTTIEIGLIGPEHTASSGFKLSEPSEVNEVGQVIGYSSRHNGGGVPLGRSIWLYDGTTTTDVALTGPEYTRSDGYKFSDARSLNEAGQVIGHSERFNGGNIDLGNDAWFYDALLDQTFSLRLSMRSDGYANSFAQYLGEDGLVVGSYSLFDALDNNLGQRVFYFTIADGLHDLGSLVDGGLTAYDWEFLANVVRANSQGRILGYGKLISQPSGQMAYLMTPVPEPTSFFSVALCAAALFTRRWRRERESSGF